MWSHSIQMTGDFIPCHFRLPRTKDKTHTHSDQGHFCRFEGVCDQGHYLSSYQYHFPNACRLSPARQRAERRAAPTEILLYLQGNWAESEKDIEKNEDCVCTLACFTSSLSSCDKSMRSTSHILTCMFALELG